MYVRVPKGKPPGATPGEVAARLVACAAVLAAAAVALAAAAATNSALVLLAVMAALAALFRKSLKSPQSVTHGSSRLATDAELKQSGMLDGDGLVLCRQAGTERPSLSEALRGLFFLPWPRSGEAIWQLRQALSGRAGRNIVRAPSYTHALIAAGSGAGKGIGFILPNLIEQRHSVVCLDVKGENASLTARIREHYGPVHVFDPWGISGRPGECFNPLDTLDPSSRDFLDDCRTLAEAIVERSPQDREVHFSDMAVSVLQVFIAFVKVYARDGEKNLITVKQLLSGQSRFQKTLEKMATSDACGGILRHLAAELSAPGERERGSILSTVSRGLAAFASPAVAEHLSRSTFDYLELVNGDRPATLYWCIPANRLASHKALARVWVSCLLLRIMQRPPSEERKTLLILDEVAQLGALPIVEQAITLTRGWGVRIALIVQSRQQLDRLFEGGADTVMNNCGTQLYFGIRDIKSAEAVSKRIGQTTVFSGSYQTGDGGSSGLTQGNNDLSHSTSSSWSSSATSAEQGRALIQPEEIARLPNEVCIAFTEGMDRPILGERLAWFREPEYALAGAGLPPAPTRPMPARAILPAWRRRLRLAGLLVTAMILLFDAWALWDSSRQTQKTQAPAPKEAETHRGNPPAANREPKTKGPPP